MQNFTTYPLCITPLSPIHIGSGDDLDWTKAVLHDGDMVLFDPLRASLPDKALAEIEKATQERDAVRAIMALQRIFKANVSALTAAETSRIRLTQSVRERYEKSAGHNTQAGTGGGGAINQLGLSRYAFDPKTGRPYIPGSSLKGALRTAEIARLHKQENPNPPAGPNPAFGSKDDPSDHLLGRFSASTFARVMLADAHATRDITGLAAYVQCIRRRPKEGVRNELVKLAAELIPPFIPGLFTGEIRIGAPRGPSDPVRRSPKLPELMVSVHNFHIRRLNELLKTLNEGHHSVMDGWVKGMIALLKDPTLNAAFNNGQAALIRLGKFCSAESKTVEWRSIRNTKAKHGGPQRMLNSTTFWLADLGARGRLPPGWAILELGEMASAPVQGFCETFADPVAAAPPPPLAEYIPPTPRIIPEDAEGNLRQLKHLEDQALARQDFVRMLENLAKQSRTWASEEKAIFARLYWTRLRDNIPRHKQANLDKVLPQPAA